MPKIIVLRGNSGSGKTTISKELQRNLGRGTLVVPQDFVRREMLWVKDRQNNQAVGLLVNLIEYGFHHCEVIILEGILHADIYEKLFERIEHLFAGSIFAYYFNLSFEETMERHKQRTSQYDFGESEMRKWWRDKDLLTGICEKMIYKEMGVNEIVDMICQDIQN